eukprot:1754968-Prymnesium_polylepis.3
MQPARSTRSPGSCARAAGDEAGGPRAIHARTSPLPRQRSRPSAVALTGSRSIRPYCPPRGALDATIFAPERSQGDLSSSSSLRRRTARCSRSGSYRNGKTLARERRDVSTSTGFLVTQRYML